MSKYQAPIFIFSLPRAGSTMLQRVLMGHSEIASVAEPWVLLPFLYAQKEAGILTDYAHQTSKIALSDFINNLPHQKDDYFKSLRMFINDLYSKQCVNNEKYFLDKTPRYHLIIPEILELFPKAKLIFLFRNPLHIFSSIIQTWGGGGLGNIYPYMIDLNDGVANLSEGYSLCKDRAIKLRYEDFVKFPEKTLNDVCNYLEIEYIPNLLKTLNNQDIKGVMGDPNWQIKREIEDNSLRKWENSFTNISRIKIAKKIIKSYKAEHLSIQGYDRDAMISELLSTSYSPIPNFIDWVNWRKNYLISKFKLNLFFGKATPMRQKNKVLM